MGSTYASQVSVKIGMPPYSPITGSQVDVRDFLQSRLGRQKNGIGSLLGSFLDYVLKTLKMAFVPILIASEMTSFGHSGNHFSLLTTPMLLFYMVCSHSKGTRMTCVFCSKQPPSTFQSLRSKQGRSRGNSFHFRFPFCMLRKLHVILYVSLGPTYKFRFAQNQYSRPKL